ncbi:MAG: tetratricopeptide repeat protein, partial [Desulfovibrio sp.]|nr:tetratricopeptide repeat protein [Desulfovibrio sp.]
MENKLTKTDETNKILTELESEIGQENAPLLAFITTHGGKIAACVLLFLVIVGTSGLIQWYQNKQQRNCLEEKIKIEQSLTGQEKIKALQELFAKAPSKLKSLLAFEVADAASSIKDYATAEKFYDQVAKEDADSHAATMALIAKTACLMHQDKNAEALTLLETIEKMLPDPKPQVYLRLIADAALRSGADTKAAQIY